jgi:predicted MFS family arabinose efflux permease
MASKLPLLLLLIALTCLSQLFRVSNSVIAPELMADLHLDARQFGWAGSAFFLALFAVQLPVGLWFDRFGARRTVTVVSLLSAVGSVWISCATDASDLTAGRIVVGLGCAASFMSVVFLCARWFEPARLATALSWVFAASNIGTLAGTTPLAWVAATAGWRSGFLGLAAVSIIVTVLFYVVVRDRPPGSSLPATHREPLGEVFRGLWQVWRTKGLLPLLSMHFFAYATMLTVLGIWGGPYLFDVHKLDGVQRGNVLLAMGVAQTLGSRTGLAQESRVRRRADLGLLPGRARSGFAAAAVARRRAADRRLLLLRLRHGDRGAGPHAFSRPPRRPRRHHGEHGAVPRPHRAARRHRLYRGSPRCDRSRLPHCFRHARGWPSARPDPLFARAGQRVPLNKREFNGVARREMAMASSTWSSCRTLP